MNTIITREITADETLEAQLANHQKRCDMPADAQDFVLVAEYTFDRRWAFGTVVYDRARRAGPVPRKEAIERFDLNNWKEAVRAVFATAFGLLTSESVLHDLYDILHRCESAEAAHNCCRAYCVGRKMDYNVQIVIDALIEATREKEEQFSMDRCRRSLERVANVAGLLALAGEYQYQPSTTPSYCGYLRKGEHWDVEALLTHGTAKFEGGLTSALEYWASLANQKGVAVPVPSEALTPESLMTWAREVLSNSYAEEGGNSPNASAKLDQDGSMTLGWSGTFTPGRWIDLVLTFDDEGLHGNMQWNSGTGAPSNFLSIENLLGNGACVSFDTMQMETAEAS